MGENWIGAMVDDHSNLTHTMPQSNLALFFVWSSSCGLVPNIALIFMKTMSPQVCTGTHNHTFLEVRSSEGDYSTILLSQVRTFL